MIAFTFLSPPAQVHILAPNLGTRNFLTIEILGFTEKWIPIFFIRQGTEKGLIFEKPIFMGICCLYVTYKIDKTLRGKSISQTFMQNYEK